MPGPTNGDSNVTVPVRHPGLRVQREQPVPRYRPVEHRQGRHGVA
jgi:hypothetical protein